jgi:Raf kinase inhibitor-like YbhB/YbcL family protein
MVVEFLAVMRRGALFFILLLIACQNQSDLDESRAREVSTMDDLKITSMAFEHNGMIPTKYTCDGGDINPPLNIQSIPDRTASLVLIVDDPDAPVGTWDHWVVFDIEPSNTIDEDSVPGTEGTNSWGRTSWGGPCPPSGTHRYFFKVYALDTKLGLDSSAKKEDVEEAMGGHVLAKGEIVGKYARS